MVRAPSGATCPEHPDEPAPTVCERCGAFMCRDCSSHYAEERCPRCRPRYGKAELAERRLNRAAKAAFVRCDVCGLEGPRFDRVEPISFGAVVLVALLALASFGVLGVLYLLTLTGNRKPMCPGCERSDGLEPSLRDALPRPPGWDELTRAQSKMKVRNAAVVVVTLAVLAAGVVLLLRG